jgi:hypothetical protein
MARLPVPGSDQGSWGNILNEYLLRSHTTDGSLKADTVASSQIVNGSITAAQLSPGATSPLLGSISTASGTAIAGIVNRYDATIAPVAVTLPTVASTNVRLTIIKSDGSANSVTVDGFALANQHASVTYQSDGAGWVPVDYSTGTAQLSKVIVDGVYRPVYDTKTINLQRGKAGDFLVPMGIQYSGVSMTVTANREYALPFWIPTGLRITCVTFFVFTPAAGSQARIGIRADDAGYPGDLLYEAGTLSSATSLWRPVFFTYAPPTNLAWITLKFESGTPAVASGLGVPGLATVALDPWISPLGIPMGNSVVGALPTSFPGPRGTTTGSAGYPFININLG